MHKVGYENEREIERVDLIATQYIMLTKSNLVVEMMLFIFPYTDGCTEAVDSIRWQSDKDGHSVHSEGPAAERPLQQCHSGGAQQR